MAQKPPAKPTQAELGPAGRNRHGQASLASEKGGASSFQMVGLVCQSRNERGGCSLKGGLVPRSLQVGPQVVPHLSCT